MIIRYSNATFCEGKKTLWFEVKIPEHQWTSYCVGIPEEGPVSTSGEFNELSQEQQDYIISECREMASKMV